MIARCLVALVAVALAGVAQAAEEVPPRPLTNADEARAWQAVGRLDLDNAGFCTGALITDRHVLTAAHCLFSRRTGRQYDAGRVVFHAGMRDGRPVASRRARRFIVHRDYRFDDRDKMRRVAADVAIVELERPIRTASIQPFEWYERPRAGESVMVVSYAAGRERDPSLQDPCHMLDSRGAVLVFSCDVNFGASGSPVFVNSATGPKIASVMSAMASWKDQSVSLAASLGQPLNELLQRAAVTDPVFRSLPAIRSGKSRPSIASQLGRTVDARRRTLPQIAR